MQTFIFRILVLTHRYIGIAIGWLLLLWCLSGIVMMYVRYPQLQPAEARAALAPLDVTHCCALPAGLYAADEVIATVHVSMLAGLPVLRVTPDFGPAALVDLRNGQPIESVTEDEARQVAQQYLEAGESQGSARLLGLIERDQWTVYARYDQDRPLYHLALDDAAGTELYVSSGSGALVQKTGRSERFWNWLGSVPHWLYFTALRQNTVWWARVVIWSAVLGTFLAVFGIYLGVRQLRCGRDGLLRSPYRGWRYWHHVPGLVFGVLITTWVFSGLLSMNPWGWLETRDAAGDARRLRGEPPTWAEVRASLTVLPQAALPPHTISLEASILRGELSYLAMTRQGARHRLDAHWLPAPLTETVIARAVHNLGTEATWNLLSAEDAYYYSHGRDRVELPVLRVMTQDEQTRYYLDAISGALLRKVDDNARWYRWLHSGLHRLDFNPVIRMRPFWDGLMWLLLLGAATVCATGTWLGIRRLRGKR